MKSTFDTVVIISFGAIGDFVMQLNFLVALKAQRKEPTRYVVLATTNAGLLREMAGAYSFVEIVPMTPFSLVKCWLRIGLRPTLVVLSPTFVSLPHAIMSVARLFSLRGALTGFSGRVNTPHLGIVVPFEVHKRMYENFDALLWRLGYRGAGGVELLFPEDTQLVHRLDAGYVVVAPFASNPGKSLSPERWHKLFSFLQETYPEREVVVVGGPRDKAQADAYCSGQERMRNYCSIPFAQLAALMKNGSCFVGVDSGLTHVAGALHVPSVIIDNLRAVTWLPTYNPRAIILTEKKHCVCGGDKTGDCNYVIDGVSYLRCMYDVSDERIHDAIAETLTV